MKLLSVLVVIWDQQEGNGKLQCILQERRPQKMQMLGKMLEMHQATAGRRRRRYSEHVRHHPGRLQRSEALQRLIWSLPLVSIFPLFPCALGVLSGARFPHNGGVVASAAAPPECPLWRRRFERAHSKVWLIKGAFHLWILPWPGMPETRQRSDAKTLTAEALMTSVYASARKNKHGNKEGGSEYSAVLMGQSEHRELAIQKLFPECIDHSEATLASALPWFWTF